MDARYSGRRAPACKLHVGLEIVLCIYMYLFCLSGSVRVCVRVH